MKKIQLIVVSLLALSFTACEYDNYEPPAIRVSGQLTSNGANFLYDGAGSRSLLKLIQKGYGKDDPGTPLYINQDGSFTQLVFPGEYWLTLDNNPYPFELPDFPSLGGGMGYDSIHMNITSDVLRNFEVIPYYFISDFSATVERKNIVLTATVTKNPAVSQQNIPEPSFVRGFIGTNTLVNSGSRCTKQSRARLTNGTGTVSVSIPISGSAISYRGAYTYNTRDYAYCRIALELDGIPNYYLFSETIKLEGIPQE